MSYTPTPFDQYTTYGLQTAQNMLDAQRQGTPQYPGYVSSQQQAPISMSYYNYTPNAPMAQVAAPNYQITAGSYQGLMGGDYDRLESALRQPGEIAAQQGFQQGLNQYSNIFGGRGMYGSTIMGNQMNEGLMREYINSLSSNASNATARRYGMEQSELAALNQFNLTREQDINRFLQQGFSTDVNQQRNVWAAGLADAERQNAYNQNRLGWDYQMQNNLRDWQNKSAYEAFTYNLARQAYDTQMQEMMMNRALAIAGQGAPLQQAYLNYNVAQQQAAAARDAANEASRAQTTASLTGALGTAGGGLLGSSGFWEWLG